METQEHQKQRIHVRNKAHADGVWFTMLGICKIGTYSTNDELHKALIERDVVTDDYTAGMIRHTQVAATEEELLLVEASGVDLGATNSSTSYSFVVMKASASIFVFEEQEYTVEVCPPETALQLCLQSNDIQISFDAYVTMEQINDLRQRPSIYQVEYDEKSKKVTLSRSMFWNVVDLLPQEDSEYSATSRFIFCLRKKA